MLFHRRQDAQIALDTSRVVIANILLDHLNKLMLADEPSAVIQNTSVYVECNDSKYKDGW